MDNKNEAIHAKRTIVEETPTFSQQEAMVIYYECTSLEVLVNDVFNKLTGIIKRLTELVHRDSGSSDEIESVDNALLLSKGLKKAAQDNNALKFYYFGLYQAYIEALQKDINVKSKEAQEQNVAARKHFAEIMQVLYRKQICRHSEMAQILQMNPGNLSREMERLVEIGYVGERKVGKYKFYNLSPIGFKYYDTYLRMEAQLDTRASVVFTKRKEPESKYMQIYFNTNLSPGGYIIDAKLYMKQMQYNNYIFSCKSLKKAKCKERMISNVGEVKGFY